MLSCSVALRGQSSSTASTSTPAPSSQTSSSNPQSGTQQPSTDAQKPQVDVEGPQSTTAPVIVRKKTDADAPPKPEPKPEQPKKIEGLSEPTFSTTSALVNVDVSVIAKNGQFIPGLHKENFQVYEDGQPQKVINFAVTEKPITAVLLVEFADIYYNFLRDALIGAYTFTDTLKKDDYVAVVEYDMKTRMLVDFTQDKNAVRGALNQLRIPGFHETNLFDALYDTVDRLEGVPGHKYIILLTRGIDTFSKINLDKIYKKVQGANDVTIYAISTGQALRLYMEANGMENTWGGQLAQLDFLQADNQLKTFASMTGGKAYFPRFEGEFPEIFGDIAATVRNQYSLAYHPTNTKLDGSYRKLKVKLIAPDGEPLKVVDQHGKEVKYTIIARDGYRAQHQVE